MFEIESFHKTIGQTFGTGKSFKRLESRSRMKCLFIRAALCRKKLLEYKASE